MKADIVSAQADGGRETSAHLSDAVLGKMMLS